MIPGTERLDAATVKVPDTYAGFGELCRSEVQGKDYRIVLKRGCSGIAVIAPHGGNIELGTSEIARAIASADHTFYGFEGLKSSGNRKLHITSTNFDEPLCLDVLGESKAVVILHGCKGNEEEVCVGGRDARFKSVLAGHLHQVGFRVGSRPDLQGRDTRNLCNGCLGGTGVQLELTRGLRRLMFRDLTDEGRKSTTPMFITFVSAVRRALAFHGIGD
jgi:phage replication-related protein YjqB (UPF0714/DUF867 family)